MLPQDIYNKLLNCYNAIVPLLINDNFEQEPFESVSLVEEYRQCLKPNEKDIKIILLAESHVLTNSSEIQISIKRTLEELTISDYPKQYVKFVYCLAYGERYLTQDSLHPERDGTPQYWELFYSCNNTSISSLKNLEEFAPILSTRTKNNEIRLLNKIELLKDLLEKGIWLVDASIVGLYNNRKQNPDGTSKKKKPDALAKIIETSWKGFTMDVVDKAKPKCVICIGKTVFDTLESELKKINGIKRLEWVYQPDYWLTSSERINNYRKVSTICQQVLE
jgi:hypothetical protein